MLVITQSLEQVSVHKHPKQTSAKGFFCFVLFLLYLFLLFLTQNHQSRVLFLECQSCEINLACQQPTGACYISKITIQKFLLSKFLVNVTWNIRCCICVLIIIKSHNSSSLSSSTYICGSFLRKVYQKCDMGLQKSKLLFLTAFCGI